MQSPPELAPAAVAPPSAVTGSSEARPLGPARPASRRPPSPSPSLPPGNLVRALIKTLRPHQWVKNLFVLAPIVFSKDLVVRTSVGPALNLVLTGRALATTGIFCLLAGAVYTINDLVDVEADRVHPIKRERPIASGAVPAGIAVAMAVVLFVLSLGAAYLLDPILALVVFVYLAQNVAYSFRLKKIAWFDVVLIAFGFVLRVLAGGIATGVRVSAYMLACTALLALFLGFGKRRHELMLEHAGRQRAALQTYTPRALNLALGVTGTATLATYVAYTLDPVTRAFFNSDHLWVTAPFTAFGIGRFLQLVSGRAWRGRGRFGALAPVGVRAESPTQEMLRDVPFVLNLVLWVAVVAAVVYKLRPAP